MSAIIDRILNTLGDKELLNKILSMPKSDLNSLLLKIFQLQANKTTPSHVIKTYKSNRFSRPSEIDPVKYHMVETEFLSFAQKNNIKAVLLSPSAPLASCSTFGCVDQNNVVSAIRDSEILADPSNMLSIIIADKLMRKELSNQKCIHFCTTARILRAQPLLDIKGFYPHFGLFCIVSSGKDKGSYLCEKELLLKHLVYYKALLTEKYDAKLSVVLRKRRGYTDNDGFFSRMTEIIRNEFPDIPVSLDLEQEENNYYKGLNFKLYMEKNNEKFEIGDGGFVDWMTKMTNNRKERCLISAVGIDRLLTF
ncbi:MAG: hypothetical protein ACOX6U_03045 [Oscillospiraceae bacterium]